MQIQMQCNVKLTRTASTSKSCVFGLPPGCSPSTAAFEDAHPMAPGADHGNVCADAFRVLEELCARPARAADIDATQFSSDESEFHRVQRFARATPRRHGCESQS